MSFYYYVLTNNTSEILKNNRFKLFKTQNKFLYYRAFEGIKFWTDRSKNDITLTPEGFIFLQQVRNEIGKPYLFSYVLLNNQENESDFATIMLCNQATLTITGENQIIQLREVYLIK